MQSTVFERRGRDHSQNSANPIWQLTTVPILQFPVLCDDNKQGAGPPPTKQNALIHMANS